MLRKIGMAGLVGTMLLAGIGSAASATEPKARDNIVQVVVKASGAPGTFDNDPHDYDILREAVLAAKLDGALSGPGPFTVFAPSDGAFRRTALSLGLNIGGGSEKDVLGAVAKALGDKLPVVLTYHVVGKRLGPIEVLQSDKLTTLAGETFQVKGLRLVDNQPDVPNPWLNVFALDIQASNGVIHGITRVLLPSAL